MGIIRMTLLTVGVMGAAMMHFGRDDGLPADRIGREPTVDQSSIVAVSAQLPADNAAVVAQPSGNEVISTANAQAAPALDRPAPALLVKASATTDDTKLTPAAKAEAAARAMAMTKPASAIMAPADDTGMDTLYVSGSSVNMRGGPSTRYGVVSRLTRGMEVIEIAQTDNGWSQIKVVETGARGFMASKFLKPQL
ncbi:SH3 domain-containing protein [Aliiroseovarius marinus]|uniref:SH3 domain-containing protein n=1 Tax=Aliiroseovarius marinus TaxID=2500159 RepID=UPI003D7C7D51